MAIGAGSRENQTFLPGSSGGILAQHRLAHVGGDEPGRHVPHPGHHDGQLAVQLGHGVLGRLGFGEGLLFLLVGDPAALQLGRVGVIQGAADRAGAVIGEPGGQLADHAVDPLPTQPQRVLPQVAGVLAGRGALFAQVADARIVVGQLSGVGGRGPQSLGLGPGRRELGGRPLGCVPLLFQRGQVGALPGQDLPGLLEVAGPVGGAPAGLGGGRVLGGGLLVHRGQGLQAAGVSTALGLGGREVGRPGLLRQPGRGRRGPGLDGRLGGADQGRRDPSTKVTTDATTAARSAAASSWRSAARSRCGGPQVIAAGQQGGAALLTARLLANRGLGGAGPVQGSRRW